MKIYDTVRIKDRDDIITELLDTPGWDSEMDRYCGKEYKIEKISKFFNNKIKWVRLKNIPFYIWHVDWLINIEILPPVFCIAKNRYAKNTGKFDKCEFLQESLSQNKCIKYKITFSNYASKTCRNWKTLEKNKNEKIDYLPEDLFEI